MAQAGGREMCGVLSLLNVVAVSHLAFALAAQPPAGSNLAPAESNVPAAVLVAERAAAVDSGSAQAGKPNAPVGRESKVSAERFGAPAGGDELPAAEWANALAGGVAERRARHAAVADEQPNVPVSGESNVPLSSAELKQAELAGEGLRPAGAKQNEIGGY